MYTSRCLWKDKSFVLNSPPPRVLLFHVHLPVNSSSSRSFQADVFISSLHASLYYTSPTSHRSQPSVPHCIQIANPSFPASPPPPRRRCRSLGPQPNPTTIDVLQSSVSSRWESFLKNTYVAFLSPLFLLAVGSHLGSSWDGRVSRGLVGRRSWENLLKSSRTTP